MNFQCTDPSGYDYAPKYVQQIIDKANLFLTAPAANQFGSSPAPPDTRIRYQLFGNPSDPCDAIFFYDTEPTSFSNTSAFHIVVYDNDAIGIAGQQSSDRIYLFNIHREVFEYLNDDVSAGAGILNHEFGHLFGLCHAFSTFNTCPDMDPAAECGGPSSTMCEDDPCPTVLPNSPYPTTCGGNLCLSCYCSWGTGNNIMGYNGSMRGITMSQWAQIYSHIITQKPEYILFNSITCEDIPAHLPLEILPNTIVEWNTFRLLNQNVEVRPGATLIIRCEVQVAKGLRIIVNRGARLFVLGGTITSQTSDCRWEGILVHGNAGMAQPDPAVARDETQPIPEDGAGVVWLNGAILKNAVTAISTKASGGLDDHGHYGGLVMVDNSDFINNGRAVEFMKYGKTNKSYFTNCDILREGTVSWAVDRGVSIWACHGIKFFQTHFDKILDYGIYGINYSAIVEASSFRASTYGFRSESTMPNVALSTTLIKGCDFNNNDHDIYANSSPNMIYGFEITENDFFEGRSFISYGVRIIGESAFNIGHDNTFDDKYSPTLLSSTGSLFNTVRCNTYKNSILGVSAAFNNRNLEILGNGFQDISVEVRLTGNASQKGEIGPQQGNPSEAAGNCFENPVNAIVAPSSSSVPFTYYVYNLNNNPVFCEKPTGNLSDGGTNNYKLDNSDSETDDCSSPESPREVTENDLFLARDTTAVKKAAWLSDLQNAQKKSAYLAAAKEQDFLLRTLVSEAFDTDDLDGAETLLLGENTNTHRRGVVGLRTMRGNIAGAQALLDSMPIENQDDLWFRQIMAVNFAIEQSSVPYELTAAEEDSLMLIANTPHSIMRGYACALLSLCKGYTCEDMLDSLEIEERNRPILSAAAKEQVMVYPNPTAGSFTVECPALQGEMLTLDLLTVSGSRVKSLRFVNTGKFLLEYPELQEGIYLLRLYNSNQLLHTAKVVVLH